MLEKSLNDRPRESEIKMKDVPVVRNTNVNGIVKLHVVVRGKIKERVKHFDKLKRRKCTSYGNGREN